MLEEVQLGVYCMPYTGERYALYWVYKRKYFADRLSVGLSHVCTVCHHITHLRCWQGQDFFECPTGCGCYCEDDLLSTWCTPLLYLIVTLFFLFLIPEGKSMYCKCVVLIFIVPTELIHFAIHFPYASHLQRNRQIRFWSRYKFSDWHRRRKMLPSKALKSTTPNTSTELLQLSLNVRQIGE